MKSILVIGMGRFGRHLANKFAELGNDVLVVDKDEKIINDLSSRFTDAYVGDCTNENAVKSLGVNSFDLCFVTIGDNFQSSLEITSLLKEQGAKHIVSKATVDMQAKFLEKIGANEVVYPERDMAENLAIRYSANNILDYIELNKDYAIYEMPCLPSWDNKSILEINVRKNYHVNIVAIKKNDSSISFPDATYIFNQSDHLMIIGKNEDVMELTNKFNEKKKKK